MCWISSWSFIPFSRGSTVFIGGLIERSSTVSLTETGFGFIVFSLLLLQPAMGGFIGFLFWIWLCWDLVSHWLILLSEGISSLE